MTTQIDHAATQARFAALSNEALRFIIKDASEALVAMPNGAKASYYQDEVCYASMELRKRAGRLTIDEVIRSANIYFAAERAAVQVNGEFYSTVGCRVMNYELERNGALRVF